MSTPNFPRIYRLNTIGAPPNLVQGISSGRAGDLVLDGAGSLFYYTGGPTGTWAQLSSGGSLFPPVNSDIVLEPSQNPAGNGYSTTISGGDGLAGNGGFLRLTSGTGTVQSGNILIDIPSSSGANNGSSIFLTSGNAGNTGGDGGGISIFSGSSTVGNGGNIDIATGSGILDGSIILRTAFTELQRISVQAGLELRSQTAVVISDVEATVNGICGLVRLSENIGPTITVNNTYIQAGSIVFAQIIGVSGASASTQILRSVVPAAGSVNITTNAAPGIGEFTEIAFLVITPII